MVLITLRTGQRVTTRRQTMHVRTSTKNMDAHLKTHHGHAQYKSWTQKTYHKSLLFSTKNRETTSGFRPETLSTVGPDLGDGMSQRHTQNENHGHTSKIQNRERDLTLTNLFDTAGCG